MKKKGVLGISLVIKIIIAIALFLVIYSIFYKPTFYENILDKIQNLFSIPERDPLPWQSGNMSVKKAAVGEYQKFIEAYKKTATSTNGDFCFGGFKAFPGDFYQKQFYIQLVNEGGKTSIQLIQRTANDANEAQNKILQNRPLVNPTIIEGVEPCLVYGNEVASNFYNDLLNDEPENKKTKIGNYVFPVGKIALKKENVLEYYINANGEKTGELGFDKGTSRTVYYLMKQNNHICLIPTSVYGFWYSAFNDNWGCVYEDDGSTDPDCLDYDKSTGKGKRLPYLLLPGGRLDKYVCSNFNAKELI